MRILLVISFAALTVAQIDASPAKTAECPQNSSVPECTTLCTLCSDRWKPSWMCYLPRTSCQKTTQCYCNRGYWRIKADSPCIADEDCPPDFVFDFDVFDDEDVDPKSAAASALTLTDLEEWTNAIRLKQTEKVKELLQTPRNLLSKAQEKIANIQDVQYQFQEDFVGYFVANRTIERIWGWDILQKFLYVRYANRVEVEIEKALDWFEPRCSDVVTPVSGDLRVLLEKAKNGFQHQLQFLKQVQKGFSLLNDRISPLIFRSADGARLKAIQVATTFFAYFEHGLSTQTLSHVSPALDDFYQFWSEKKIDKVAVPHKPDVKEWTEAIHAGDKQKVRDLTQVPMSLFKKSYEKGAQVIKLVRPLMREFGPFILTETIDRKAAFLLLNETVSSLQHLKLDSDLLPAEEWFNERTSDEVTPVSGDARAWFQKASDAIRQQQKDVSDIQAGIGAVWWWLANLMESKGPEAEKQVRRLWPAFYAGVGLRTGVKALLHFEADLDSFCEAWTPA